jgi:hypothetical protein
MSNTNTGGPAFPLPSHTKRWNDVEKCYVQDEGMTLRDYFAAKAMQQMVNEYEDFDFTARTAYELADSMLKARGQ